MPSTFDDACAALEAALNSPLRGELVNASAAAGTQRAGLAPFAKGMSRHVWNAGGTILNLSEVVETLDAATRREGLHVLHDWDGKAERVTTNSIARDVLELLIAQRGAEPPNRTSAAIVLDFYFLYLLALVAMRSWDEGEPGANLDRVTGLLAHLQGPLGSGQRFADNAETLLIIGTSHYEPNEAGYDLLLARARALPRSNRTAMALTHAQAMGGHLRFGYEVTYGKDFKAMRDDNGADYPWLLFGLAGLMDEYDRLTAAGASDDELAPVVEGLINGLTPDPAAVLGTPVRWFAPHQAEFDRLLALLAQHRRALIAAIDVHRPRDQGYSPIALFFNFSQNVLKGAVVDALLKGAALPVGLNDLFTGIPRDPAVAEARAGLARRLTAYARAKPDTIRGRLSPVIVYDPVVGRQSFGGAVRALKNLL